MKCWSCAAENDLGTTQTCVACGAPLVKTRGVFRTSVLIGIVLAGLFAQALCVFGQRACR